MQLENVEPIICSAIRNRWMVMFEYGDLIRVVEPHRIGINAAGHLVLNGWMRAGYSRSDSAGGWRTFLLSDIHGIQLLDAPFGGTRPGYAARDARFTEVRCELPYDAHADAQDDMVQAVA